MCKYPSCPYCKQSDGHDDKIISTVITEYTGQSLVLFVEKQCDICGKKYHIEQECFVASEWTSDTEKWIEINGEQWHDFYFEKPPIVGEYYRVLLNYNRTVTGKVQWNGRDFVVPMMRPITDEVIGWK